MKTSYLTREQLLRIQHNQLVETEDDTILSDGNLDFCIEVARQEYFGEEIYKTTPQKAAAIICSIDKRHPFLHANKRTGFQACDVFLRLNGFFIDMKTEEAVAFSKEIAQCFMDIDQTSIFLQDHIKKLECL